MWKVSSRWQKRGNRPEAMQAARVAVHFNAMWKWTRPQSKLHWPGSHVLTVKRQNSTGEPLTLCLVNWNAWQFKLRLLGELNWNKYCIFHVFLMTGDRLLYISTARQWYTQQRVQGSAGVLRNLSQLTHSHSFIMKLNVLKRATFYSKLQWIVSI